MDAMAAQLIIRLADLHGALGGNILSGRLQYQLISRQMDIVLTEDDMAARLIGAAFLVIREIVRLE
jgi:hypothetical protein